MAVNVKLGVDLGDFSSGIKTAKEQIKTFDAALKYAEASLKATGDAESAMVTKTENLNAKMKAQKQIVDQYTAALEKMRSAGVDPTSSSYQKMQQDLLKAQAAMMNTKAQINELNTSQTAAAKSADTLAENVGKIGKNVSLQTVADGLNKLNTSLERGARTAIRLGKNIARSAMDSTGWADDLSTRSTQYGIDVETLQRMDRVAAYIDTDVDAIITAKDRMSKNRESLAELLGISSDGKTVDAVFWEAGQKIMDMGDAFDQNETAMKIFGRSWRELLPLFTAGREEYEALMNSQDVMSAEQVEKLAKADDAFQQIQQEVQMLKNQFWADNSQTIVNLLQWVVDNKEGVVAALTAIAGAFAAMKLAEVALNLTRVVNGFRDLHLFGNGGNGAPTGTGGTNPTQPTGTGTGGFGAKIMNGVGAMIVVDYDPTKALEYKHEYGARAGTAKYIDSIMGSNLYELQTEWDKSHGRVEIPAEAKVAGDEAEKIAKQIGPVTVPVNVQVSGFGGSAIGGGGSGGIDPLRQSIFGAMTGYANGIAYVPNKRLAWLHPGETVTPARAVESRSYNSNLYVERMIMNNGTDAAGLASAMAAAQRRTMSGYGS